MSGLCMHAKAANVVVKKEQGEQGDGGGGSSGASTVSTATDGADMGPVQSFVMKHFGSKQAYNKFRYRLKTCGEAEAKSRYESLQDALKNEGAATEEDSQELEELIVSVTNKLPIDHIVGKRKIVDEKAGIGKEGWV